MLSTAMIVAVIAAFALAAAPTPAKPPALVDVGPARQALLKLHPDEQMRFETGLRQVQALWLPHDGDKNALRDFAVLHFATAENGHVLFQRLERALEQIDGHFLEIGRELRAPTELDLPEFNPTIPVDDVFAGWDPAAHVLDDLFDNKLAFIVLLNFPVLTLAQRTEPADVDVGGGDGHSISYQRLPSRDDHIVGKLTDRFTRRVPAAVNARAATVAAAADRYIANYNLWMHHVLDERGQRVFPSGKRLISHWNLRDELKAQYANGADGLNRQRTIVKVMERIVTQTIPAAVIDSPWFDYNPFTNKVTLSTTSEKPAPAKLPSTSVAELTSTTNRYQQLLDQFHAAKAADVFSPTMPTAIQRSFELNRALPEKRVEQLFLDVLTSPLVPQVAAEIRTRLSRPLEPQDLWFDGFKARASIKETELDAITKKKYPTADAFKKDIPRILRDLGFAKDTAQWLADRIVVDPARGAGHALQSARRGDLPHLRTRVEADGMDYKGYNIAVHELGHNVEQLFSLYKIDSTLLAGVPNNAFTEAIAFVFQARDLELLGIKPAAADLKRAHDETVLNDFWSTWEIAGVALVDVAVWHWMYEHPTATPTHLRDATVRIAGDIWKKHYAPVLGGVDSKGVATPLLGIYSHMIAYPLYLSDYPLGHLISLQIEEQVARATSSTASRKTTLGAEIERMCIQGAVPPDVWMRGASGDVVSAQPLLRATEKALTALSAASPSKR